MSETKRIVLIAHIQILELISDQLTQRGYEVIRQLPVITVPVINDIISLKPDCIIISEGSQFDDEYTLLKAIQAIKSKYNTRIIVHTRTRKVGDQLLSDLVTLNVYDFIPLNSFDFSEILTLLNDPRDYSDVVKYHNYDKVSTTQENSAVIPSQEIIKQIVKERVEVPVEVIKEVVKEVHVPIVPKGLKNIIAVTGLSGVGKTYIATNLAQTLDNLGAKVAIVEANLENRHLFASFEIEDCHKGYTKLFDQSEKDIPEKFAGHIGKNLWVFSIPLTDKSNLPTVTLASVLSAIDRLRTTRDIIIFDCNAMDDSIYIQLAQTIILVSNQVIPKVLETDSYLEKKPHWKSEKSVLVLNRGDKTINASDINMMFKMPNKYRVIPSNDKEAIIASINGQCAIEQSKIAADAFIELASEFWQTSVKSSNRLSKIFSLIR